MTEMMRNLRRRAPRFQVKNSDVLNVTVSKGDHSFDPIQTEIVNISVGGAKFKSKQPVPVNEYLFVKVESEHLKQALSVSGKVKWIVPLENDEWWLGCAFVPAIPFEILNDFARRGILERRDHPYRTASLKVTVEWQSEKNSTEVTVVDYSQGGLCFVSEKQSTPGDRVTLWVKLEDERQVRVRAIIRWRAKSSDGYLIGCEFAEPRDYFEISNVLESRNDFEAEEAEARELKKAAEQIFGHETQEVRQPWSLRQLANSLREAASWLLFSLAMFGLLVVIVWQQLISEQPPQVPETTTVLTGVSLEQSEHRQQPQRPEEKTVAIELGDEALLKASALGETATRTLSPDFTDSVDPLEANFTESLERPAVIMEASGTAAKLESGQESPQASSRVRKVAVDALPAVREAVQAQRKGNYLDSLQHYRRAVQLDPTSSLVWYLLAATQFEVGHHREAELSLQHAFQSEGKRPLDDLSRYTGRFSADTRSWLWRQRSQLRGSN